MDAIELLRQAEASLAATFEAEGTLYGGDDVLDRIRAYLAKWDAERALWRQAGEALAGNTAKPPLS